MAQIIPLDNSPNQTFAVNLNVDGNVLSLILTVRFNTMAGCWNLGIFTTASVSILACLPMLTGSYPAGNLLEQYRYLAIGSAYILNVGSSSLDYPDASSLGTDFVLLWDDTPAF